MTSEEPCADGDDLLDARDYLAAARRAHGEPGGTFNEVYMWVLALVLAGLMTSSGWGSVMEAGACTGTRCVAGAGANPVAALALTLLVVAGLLRVAAALGPAGVAGAPLTWLLSGPAPRRPGLRARLWGMAVGGALVGCLAGLVVAATLGLAPWPAAAWGLPGGAALGLLSVGVPAATQASPVRRGLVGRSATALGLLGVLAGAVTRARPDLSSASGLTLAPWWALPLLLVAAAGGFLLLRADHRLDDVDGVELRRAGETSDAAWQSLQMMDSSALVQRAARGRLGTRGTRPSRRGRGTGAVALVARDLVRCARQGDRLVRAVPVLVVCLLLARLAPPLLTLPVLGVAASAVARSVGEGLVWWSGSSGLRRSLPLPDPVVRACYLVGPALVTALWSAVVVAVLGLSPWVVAALVVTALASLLASSRPVDLASMSVMVPAPMGAGMMPLGALSALRGYELPPVTMLAPAVVPGPAAVALPLAVLVWQWARCRRDDSR